MNTTPPTTMPAVVPLLMVCWLAGILCVSGDSGVDAGAVLPGRVTVSVAGANKELVALVEVNVETWGGCNTWSLTLWSSLTLSLITGS